MAERLYKTIEDINKSIVEINTNLKWMVQKQQNHDKKLESIDCKLDSGRGKIGRNTTLIKALGIGLSCLFTILLYHIFG